MFLVNDGVNDFLKLDTQGQLKRINVGTRAFQRCRNKHNGDKIVFRITQEGLQALVNCFTKRRLTISLSTLMFLISHQNIRHVDVPEDQHELKAIIEEPTLGYFALLVQRDGVIIELATIVKFASSTMLMISDENICGLKIKYNNDFDDNILIHKPITKHTTEATKDGKENDVDEQ